MVRAVGNAAGPFDHPGGTLGHLGGTHTETNEEQGVRESRTWSPVLGAGSIGPSRG